MDINTLDEFELAEIIFKEGLAKAFLALSHYIYFKQTAKV